MDSSDDDNEWPDVCIPPNIHLTHKRPRVIIPPSSHKRYSEVQFAYDVDFEKPNEVYDIEVDGYTWDSDSDSDEEFWNNQQGVMWDFQEGDDDDNDMVQEDGSWIFERLQDEILVGKTTRKQLINVSPSDPLFEGSPYSARDFCRYLTAVKHSMGKIHHYINNSLHK